MSDDKRARSMRRHLHELQSIEGADDGHLVAHAVRMLDENVDIGTISLCVEQIRHRGNTEQCRELDRHLLGRIAGFTIRTRVLSSVLSKGFST